MASQFKQTSEDELESVIALMQHSFHAAAEETPTLNSKLLGWKYHGASHLRPGSRSYVLSDKGSFVAHAAIWPIELRLQSGVRSGISFCDWAAREEQRGIGLLLLKKITTLAPFVLAIGGAEITRQILPRVGFKPWANLPLYVRVVRPFKQLATRPSRNWKEPMRVARNTAWSLAPLHSHASWTLQYAIPDERLLAGLNEQTGSMYTQEFLHFMTHCPTTSIRCVVLYKNQTPTGYAVLSLAGRQGRIAELRLASTDQSDWNAAVALVEKTFRGEKIACEVAALASVPLFETALQANAFRERERRPLVVLDSAGAMTEEPVPQLGMLVDDASFNYFPEFPYAT